MKSQNNEILTRQNETNQLLKVLIIANDTTYTYNLRNEIIKGLVDEGFEVVVVSQPLLHQNSLRALGARLIDIQTNRHRVNPIFDLLLFIKYFQILHAESPNVTLTFNIKPNVYGGIACRLTRTVYMPNITGLGRAMEEKSLLQILAIKLYKAGIRESTCVFFQNKEDRQFFCNHRIIRAGSRTVLLPGSGVNLQTHKPLDYPVDNNGICFLFAARIVKEKGIDIYLSAAKYISAKYNNVSFHICGICDDERYKIILEEAQREGYIFYHGEQKNIVSFYEMSHCVIHPSYYPEGMSNVLLEAAAHCRPIITTDRPGCRETIDDGVTGFLVPTKNEDALVCAIERFLKLNWTERKQMGIMGRKKVEREFDREIVQRKYFDEIKRALL